MDGGQSNVLMTFVHWLNQVTLDRVVSGSTDYEEVLSRARVSVSRYTIRDMSTVELTTGFLPGRSKGADRPSTLHYLLKCLPYYEHYTKTRNFLFISTRSMTPNLILPNELCTLKILRSRLSTLSITVCTLLHRCILKLEVGSVIFWLV